MSEEEEVPTPHSDALFQSFNDTRAARCLISGAITGALGVMKVAGPLAGWSWLGVTVLLWAPSILMVLYIAFSLFSETRAYNKSLKK